MKISSNIHWIFVNSGQWRVFLKIPSAVEQYNCRNHDSRLRNGLILSFDLISLASHVNIARLISLFYLSFEFLLLLERKLNSISQRFFRDSFSLYAMQWMSRSFLSFSVAVNSEQYFSIGHKLKVISVEWDEKHKKCTENYMISITTE